MRDSEIQRLREENERLSYLNEHYKQDAELMKTQRNRLREELEQVKKERDEEWEDNYQLMHKINRVESELAAKDKVLEEVAVMYTSPGEEGTTAYVLKHKARSILSQYKEETK